MSHNLTLRAAQSQEVVRCVGRSGAIVECLTCGAQFPTDRDEDGDAEIEQVPCEGNDSCDAMLCDSCRHKCPRCDNSTCGEHIKPVGSELMCQCCAKEVADEALCHPPEAA